MTLQQSAIRSSVDLPGSRESRRITELGQCRTRSRCPRLVRLARRRSGRSGTEGRPVGTELAPLCAGGPRRAGRGRRGRCGNVGDGASRRRGNEGRVAGCGQPRPEGLARDECVAAGPWCAGTQRLKVCSPRAHLVSDGAARRRRRGCSRTRTRPVTWRRSRRASARSLAA